MILEEKNPPRTFEVGTSLKFMMHDCGVLRLAPDEQVTFVTETGAEYDVARKAWGFYATPSLNGRLADFSLRASLIRNRVTDRFFVMLVERGKEPDFHAYLEQECCEIVAWLDNTDSLKRLRDALSTGSEVVS